MVDSEGGKKTPGNAGEVKACEWGKDDRKRHNDLLGVVVRGRREDEREKGEISGMAGGGSYYTFHITCEKEKSHRGNYRDHRREQRKQPRWSQASSC